MENIPVGLSTTVIGVTIVFAVLIIISLMLSLLKLGSVKNNEKPAVKATVAAPIPIPEPEPEITGESPELIAVITAAIAASLNQSADTLVVRSLRKASPWVESARKEGSPV